MISQSASDIHFKAGLPPLLRIDGDLNRLESYPPLTPQDTEQLAKSLMNPNQQAQLNQKNEVDLAYQVPNLARFRANIFRQKGSIEIVMRAIPMMVPTVEELNLPPVLKDLALSARGLILVTGITGSGKSSTIAAMIDYVNRMRPYHIITIEDPVEFVFSDQQSSISQREVGLDTDSFGAALKYSLRQDPDVLVIGEMRDMETASIALTAAETGHLVFSTLHTIDAIQTIDRIIDFFPPNQQEQIRLQFSNVLVSTVSMRLIARSGEKGRVPAVEVLIATPTIKGYIREKKMGSIRNAIEEGASQYKMQSFDMSLLELYQKGFISREDALAEASNSGDLALQMKGISRSGASAQGQMKSFEDEVERQNIQEKLRVCREYILKQRVEDALETLQEILKRYPNHPDASALFKEAHSRLGDEAKKAKVRSLLTKAIAQFQIGKVDEAVAMWQQCLSLDPGNKQTLALLEETEKHLAVPETAELKYTKAQVLVLLDKMKEALPLLDEVLRTNPNHQQAKVLQAQLRDSLQNLDKIKESDKLIHEASMLFEEGEFLQSTQKWFQANAVLRRSETEEKCDRALKKSVEKAMEGISQDSANWDLYHHLISEAVDAFSKERYLAALGFWKKVAEQNPLHRQTQDNINFVKVKIEEIVHQGLKNAEEFSRSGRIGEAMQACREVLAVDPDNAAAKGWLEKTEPLVREQLVKLYQEGVNHFNENKFKEAIAAWEKVLLLNPTHDHARQNISRAKEKMQMIEGKKTGK